MQDKNVSRLIFSHGYTAGSSGLHRMPVRLKIGLALLLAAGAVWGGWTGIAVLALAAGAGVILARIPFFSLLKAMRPVVWFVLIAGMFPVLFASGTPVPALEWLPLTLTLEGLEAGAMNTSRLLFMFLLSWLFIHTTHPQTWMPVETPPAGGGWRTAFGEMAAVAGLAFQLLPLCCIEADRWLTEKLSAGKDSLQGNLLQKAGQVASWLAPFLASVLADGERIASGARTEPVPEENRA